ncbi:hypothetical protein FM038_016545 [Shewanella eurypsychrophilus]|uniref:Uncharacterized protein n=1 Tax=Shewanella eurypsychrophilus TaxID=2593656 RepID=A0ABX6V873_9GAMM|nr:MULTISPECIES: hypothetical protein [Shewanella]QFU23624.1 hypothetical protein FS418_18345 [Shewanella sp. YLB-09]QPG58847.1 hypothetical protein FM038_016545 [Shewanella eurypsychrophilus]
MNQGEAAPILSIEDIQSYLNSLKQGSAVNSQADHELNQAQYQIETTAWVSNEESLGLRILHLIDIIKLM